MRKIAIVLLVSLVQYQALIAQDSDALRPFPDFRGGVTNEHRLNYQALPVISGTNLAWRFSGDGPGTARDLPSLEAVVLQVGRDAARYYQEAKTSVPKGSVLISVGVLANLVGTYFLVGNDLLSSTRVGGSIVSYGISLGTMIAGIGFVTTTKLLYRKSMDAYNEWLLE